MDSGTGIPDSIAEVTMTTSGLITATTVKVTVIDMAAADVQQGTDTLTFNGPFAPDQTFTAANPDSANTAVDHCEIASVSADVLFNFTNLSPA